MEKKRAYAPSVDRNKGPIYEILKQYIDGEKRLLEIGSGTGQHAVFMGEKFKKLHWICSDVAANHLNIKSFLKEAKLSNVHGPEKLKVGVDDFPKGSFDYVFTANTMHIMSWKESKTLIKLMGRRLRKSCQVFIYGPFKYDGDFTSPSNEEFDSWLKERDSKSGIRSFEDVNSNMEAAGFKLLADHAMPANNQLLVYERLEFQR